MTIRTKFLVLACVTGLVGVTACDNNRTADRRTSSNDDVRVSDMKKADNGKSVETEQVTGIQSQDLNKSEVEKGNDKVQIHKEVTRSITSEEKVPTVLEGQRKLDINRMSASDFSAIGFPKNAADNIVSYRDKHDGFHSIDELKQVPGVSESMLRPLRGKLGFSSKH